MVLDEFCQKKWIGSDLKNCQDWPIRSDPGFWKMDLDPIQIRQIWIEIRIVDRGSALQYITVSFDQHQKTVKGSVGSVMENAVIYNSWPQ